MGSVVFFISVPKVAIKIVPVSVWFIATFSFPLKMDQYLLPLCTRLAGLPSFSPVQMCALPASLSALVAYHSCMAKTCDEMKIDLMEISV
jgi:hypothetical protein